MAHPSQHHLDRLAEEQARIAAIIEDLFDLAEDTCRQVHQHGRRVEAMQTLASAWERGEPYSDPAVAELFPEEPQAEAPKRPKRRPGGPRRLRWRQVCEIRRKVATTTQKALAVEYGISPSQVSKIVSRKTWQSPPPVDAGDDIGKWRCVS